MAPDQEHQGQTKYQVRYAKSYRKDLRRVLKSGRYDRAKLDSVIAQLAEGKELDPLRFHHKLKGDMEGYFECHIESDWLLIYRRQEDILVLVMLYTGTHAELFGL